MLGFGSSEGRFERNRQYSRWTGAQLSDGANLHYTDEELLEDAKMLIQAVRFALMTDGGVAHCSKLSHIEHQFLLDHLAPEELKRVVFE